MPPAAHFFSDFELRPATRELLRGGERVHLPPRAFAVLLFLVEHRARLCSEAELLMACWPGERVTRSSLTQAIRKIRLALDDDPAAPRFVATVQRGGYRFIAGVSAAPSRTDLVGREGELARLDGVLGEVAAGAKRVVLLVGEAGIGKSTLARAVVGRAKAHGFAVSVGACPDDASAPAFSGWDQVLEGFDADAPGPARSQPALNPIFGDAAADALDRGSAPLLRLFESVWAFLRDGRWTRPRLVLLEDVHWAHASTLALLRYLARAPAAAALCVLCTFRPDEAPRVLEQLAQDSAAQTVPLAGLDVAALRTLLADRAAPAMEAESLHRWTGGNPLFVQEILRGGRAAIADGVPRAVGDVIARRLSRLPARTQLALEVAAVFGVTFEPALVAELASLAPSEVDEVLGHERRTGLLRDAPSGQLEFAHALLREGAYARLNPLRKAELHAQAAEQLALRPVTDRRARVAALAHHAVLGASARNADMAVRHAEDAAAMALAQHAHDEASRYYEMALDAARFADGSGPVRRANLLLRRADAERWAGERKRAVATLREVQAIGRAEGEGRLVAAAAAGLGVVAFVDVVGGDHSGALRELREAVACAPADDDVLLARLWSRIALLLYWSASGPEAPAAADVAIAAAERSGEAPARAHAAFARFTTRLGPAHDAGRLAEVDALVAQAQSAREPEVEVAAMLCRAHEVFAAGDFERADRSLGEAAAALSAHAHPMADVYLSAFQSQLREGAQVVRASVERLAGRLAAMENPNTHSILAAHALVLRGAEGTLSEARAVFEDAAARHPRLGVWPIVWARLAREEGRDEAARQHLSAALDDPSLIAGRDLQWHGCAFELAALIAHFNDRAAAARWYPLLLPHAERHALWGFPAVYVGPQSLSLGRLAATLGRYEEATAHFQAALAGLRRLNAARPLIEALVAAGRHACSSEGPFEVERAAGEGLLGEAERLATRLGYHQLAARAAKAAPRPR